MVEGIRFKWICLMLVLRAQGSLISICNSDWDYLVRYSNDKIYRYKSLEYLVSCIPANKWHRNQSIFQTVLCQDQHGFNSKIRRILSSRNETQVFVRVESSRENIIWLKPTAEIHTFVCQRAALIIWGWCNWQQDSDQTSQ